MTDKAMKVGKEQEALLDALIAGCEGPQDILGEHGLLKALHKRLAATARVFTIRRYVAQGRCSGRFSQTLRR